jgi:hypothetical protein
MRLFGKKREPLKEPEMEQQSLKRLQSREVVPGRKWEYVDDDGEVVGEYIVHDPEAHRRFLETMSGNDQYKWWLDQQGTPDVTEY